MPVRSRLASLVLAVAVLVSACGSGGDGATPDELADGTGSTTPVEGMPAPQGPQPATTAESDLPSVEVLDVHTGDSVDLASFAPADHPILLWFWAPH